MDAVQSWALPVVNSPTVELCDDQNGRSVKIYTGVAAHIGICSIQKSWRPVREDPDAE